MSDNLTHLHDDPETTVHKQDSGFGNFWRRLTGKAVPPIQYFLPGQVLLQVSHPDGLSKVEIANAVGNFLGAQGVKDGHYTAHENASPANHIDPAKHSVSGKSWKTQIQPPNPESITTISSKDENGFVFSIVPAYLYNVEHHDKSHTTLIEVLISSYKEYEEANKKPISIAKDMTLKSVSPNWIMSAAYHGCATGGPGSWPVQAHSPEGDDWKFYKAQDQNGLASDELLSDGNGVEVHVAILDTAPTQHALDTAFAEWRWSHPLIESMLKTKDDPLRLYPATGPDLYLTTDFSLLGHRYWMRDHGLFVAGIIHTIAPKAKLHLYEVLNPYGAASIENIAQGLIKIMENDEIKRPLFINCSFTFAIPVPGVLDKDFPHEIRNQIRDQNGFIDYLLQTPRELFDWIVQQKDKDVHVIAAAGNDGDYNNVNSGQGRPSTRYPAAFKGVWGVGALPKQVSIQSSKYLAATYSNLADDQVPPEGYVTLGGEPGIGQGVLGVYIGDFPVAKGKGCLSTLWRFLGLGAPRLGHLPKKIREFMPEDIEYKSNTTGWAWWAGTSFATPIITGKLAAERSIRAATVVQILDAASQQSVITGPGANPVTAEGERAILVAQKARE